MTPQNLVINNSNYTPLYEHGFVGLVETMGSDQAICDAARVSYGTGTKSVSDDRNLIRYLMRQWHTSPFEMAEAKFHIKLPIFVMRQLVRHRTANLNEYSARYSVLSNEFYIPEPEYIQAQSTTNKQGRGGDISDDHKTFIREYMKQSFEANYYAYELFLGDHPLPGELTTFPGMTRELARGVVPVNNYTECYWKCDLHNLFHFLRLRMDSHAQREIQDYANAMYNHVKTRFPLSVEAFEDYRLHSKTLSRMDLLALQDMLAGVFVADANHYGMGKREYTEFVDLFRPSAHHSSQLFKTED